MPALQKEFNYTNPMQVPRLEKIVVNIGLGEALQNAKALDAAVGDLAIDHRPEADRDARQALDRRSSAPDRQRHRRQVTLRGERMWDFLERLMRLALPRIRDFRGVPGRRSTGVATTPSGCASSSCSPRSTTTRSTACAGWR